MHSPKELLQISKQHYPLAYEYLKQYYAPYDPVDDFKPLVKTKRLEIKTTEKNYITVRDKLNGRNSFYEHDTLNHITLGSEIWDNSVVTVIDEDIDQQCRDHDPELIKQLILTIGIENLGSYNWNFDSSLLSYSILNEYYGDDYRKWCKKHGYNAYEKRSLWLKICFGLVEEEKEEPVIEEPVIEEPVIEENIPKTKLSIMQKIKKLIINDYD